MSGNRASTPGSRHPQPVRQVAPVQHQLALHSVEHGIRPCTKPSVPTLLVLQTLDPYCAHVQALTEDPSNHLELAHLQAHQSRQKMKTASMCCCVRCWSGSGALARQRTRRHCLSAHPAQHQKCFGSFQHSRLHCAAATYHYCLVAFLHCSMHTLTNGSWAVSRDSYERAKKRCCGHFGPTSRSSISNVPVKHVNALS